MKPFAALLGILGLIYSLAPKAEAQTAVYSWYARWPASPYNNPNVFPIVTDLQVPNLTYHCNSNFTDTCALAMQNEKINTLMGPISAASGVFGIQDLPLWPEFPVGGPYMDQSGVKCGAYQSGDCGEFEAASQYGIYSFGQPSINDNSTSDPQSLASMVSVANTTQNSDFLAGYMLSDEPSDCAAYAAVITNANVFTSNDASRPVYDNFTASPLFFASNCTPSFQSAVQALGIASFDLYPFTSAAADVDFLANNFHVGDATLKPLDTLWVYGAAVKQLVSIAAADQPVWAYIETGSDSKASPTDNTFYANIANGVVAVQDCAGGCGGYSTQFTSNWSGLTLTFGTSSAKVATVTDSTHLTLNNLSVNASGVVQVAVTEGAGTGPYGNDCIASKNICVVSGHEWHATSEQVNAEAWTAIINGAVGIEEFCQDGSLPSTPNNGVIYYGSNSMCLGDPSFSPLSSVIANNLVYVNGNLTKFAPWLVDATVAKCSMDTINPTVGIVTSMSCTDGQLSISTNNTVIKGAALLKQHAGVYYLVVQSTRNSRTGSGITLSLSTGAAQGGKEATVIYDSNTNYHPQYSSLGQTFVLSVAKGGFQDVLGAHHDNYQVKVYSIK